MDRKKFKIILENYVSGKATREEIDLVDRWYELLDEENVTIGSQEDLSNIEQRMWAKIQQQTSTGSVVNIVQKKVALYMRFKWAAAAAVLIFTILAIGIQQSVNDSFRPLVKVEAKENMQIKENETSMPLQLRLEDGSSVTLQPGSTLSYPVHFEAGKREVYLDGEAFFSIAKNPSQPFFVYSGQVTTRVLGTSFTIKPLGDGSEIEVSVKTGRVEVYKNQLSEKDVAGSTESKGVVLTPNQRAVYYSSTGVFQAAVVMQPVPLAAEDQTIEVPLEFRFEETALREVLKALEKTYGIEIMLEKESLNDCPFTGDLSKQDLFKKLDIINLALGTTYEVKGTRILIKGNGCE